MLYLAENELNLHIIFFPQILQCFPTVGKRQGTGNIPTKDCRLPPPYLQIKNKRI